MIGLCAGCGRRREEAVPRRRRTRPPPRVPKATDLIQERAQSLRITLASMGDGVIATDDKARVPFLNPSRAGADRLGRGGRRGQALLRGVPPLTATRARPGEDTWRRCCQPAARSAWPTTRAGPGGRRPPPTSRQRPRRSATPGGNRGRRVNFSAVTGRYKLHAAARLSRGRRARRLRGEAGTWETTPKRHRSTGSGMYKQIMGVPREFEPGRRVAGTPWCSPTTFKPPRPSRDRAVRRRQLLAAIPDSCSEERRRSRYVTGPNTRASATRAARSGG